MNTKCPHHIYQITGKNDYTESRNWNGKTFNITESNRSTPLKLRTVNIVLVLGKE